MQRLLVNVRGTREALEVARGGAHLVNVEYPVSVLGAQYPLNILAVRNRLYREGLENVQVCANIGNKQFDRAVACQAALGAATAGADVIKCGFAELPFKAAAYQGDSLVRTVKRFYPTKKVIPVFYVDAEMQRFFDPFEEGPELIDQIRADGMMLDTYIKSIGKGLLDYTTVEDISGLVWLLHRIGKEAWISGLISAADLPDLWATGVDVIGVRSAVSEPSPRGGVGEIRSEMVSNLVATIPAPMPK